MAAIQIFPLLWDGDNPLELIRVECCRCGSIGFGPREELNGCGWTIQMTFTSNDFYCPTSHQDVYRVCGPCVTYGRLAPVWKYGSMRRQEMRITRIEDRRPIRKDEGNLWLMPAR